MSHFNVVPGLAKCERKCAGQLRSNDQGVESRHLGIARPRGSDRGKHHAFRADPFHAVEVRKVFVRGRRRENDGRFMAQQDASIHSSPQTPAAGSRCNTPRDSAGNTEGVQQVIESAADCKFAVKEHNVHVTYTVFNNHRSTTSSRSGTIRAITTWRICRWRLHGLPKTIASQCSRWRQ